MKKRQKENKKERGGREGESDRESRREEEDSMTVLTMWKDVRETRLKEAPRTHPIPPLW